MMVIHNIALIEEFCFTQKQVQWNLDLSFFKGMEKTNDECGKTINTGNYYTL
jgi:hypothetical protein